MRRATPARQPLRWLLALALAVTLAQLGPSAAVALTADTTPPQSGERDNHATVWDATAEAVLASRHPARPLAQAKVAGSDHEPVPGVAPIPAPPDPIVPLGLAVGGHGPATEAVLVPLARDRAPPSGPAG